MAYIESHQELARHPKVARLARILKVNKAQAIGHLHLLWWWTLDFAPEGDLSAFTSCEICAAAEWQGDEDGFKKALQESQWLDGEKIHDWDEYAGKLVRKREEARERMRELRERSGIVRARSPNVPTRVAKRSVADPPDPPGGNNRDPLSIPPALHSPAFTAAWQRWMTARRGLGKKPKDWGVLFQAQLEWLVPYGAETATEILNQSIRQGWQGLFEPKEKHGGHSNNGRQSARNDGIKGVDEYTARHAEFHRRKEEERRLAAQMAKGGPVESKRD